MMNRFLCFASLATMSVLVGCGEDGASGGESVFPVSGSVKMFGSPLANATVSFASEGEQPTAVGTTDAKGNFQLTTYEFGDGAAEGSYKIVISKASPVAGYSNDTEDAGHDADTVASHGAADEKAATNLVPAQYTTAVDTPLTAEVKSSGDNVFNLEIK